MPCVTISMPESTGINYPSPRQLQRQAASYNDPETSDIAVTLVNQSGQGRKRTVCLHTKVLASSSPVLAKMCETDTYDDNGLLAARIAASSIEAVELLLQFIYSKKLRIVDATDEGTVETVLECMKLAEQYQIADCLQACLDYVTQRIEQKENVWIRAAVQWNMVDWQEGQVKEFISEAQRNVFIHWWF